MLGEVFHGHELPNGRLKYPPVVQALVEGRVRASDPISNDLPAPERTLGRASQ